MYEGKKNTDKWFPVILLDSTDFKTAKTAIAFGSITAKFSKEGATSLTTYSVTTDDWKEAGEGKYWLRIGASEFTTEENYEVSIAASGCLTYNFCVEVRDKLIYEMMDNIDTLLTRISGTLNISGGAVEADVKKWNGQAVTLDSNNLPNVNMKAISEDLTAADYLEAILDGTGAKAYFKSADGTAALKIENTSTGPAVDVDSGTNAAVTIDSGAGLALALATAAGAAAVSITGGNVASLSITPAANGAGAIINGGSSGVDAVRLVATGAGIALKLSGGAKDIDADEIDDILSGVTAIQAKTDDLSFSENGIEADVIAISGDTGAADNLEAILDTTGGHLTLKSNARAPLTIEALDAFDAVSITAYAGKRGIYIDSQAVGSQGLYIYGEQPVKFQSTAGFAMMIAGASGSAAMRIQGIGGAPAVWALGSPVFKIEENNGSGNAIHLTTSGGSTGTGILIDGYYQGIYLNLQTGPSATYGIRIKSRLAAIRAESTEEYGIQGIGLLAGIYGLGVTNGVGAMFDGAGTGPAIKGSGIHGMQLTGTDTGLLVSGNNGAKFASTGTGPAFWLEGGSAYAAMFIKGNGGGCLNIYSATDNGISIDTAAGKGIAIDAVTGIEILSDNHGIFIDSSASGIYIDAIDYGIKILSVDIAAYFESVSSEALFLKAATAGKAALAVSSENGPAAHFNSFGTGGNYAGILVNGQGNKAGIESVGGSTGGAGLLLTGQGGGKDIDAAEIDGIKAKTDNLPDSPAASTDIQPGCAAAIAAAFTFTGGNVHARVEAKNSALDLTATEKTSVQASAAAALTAYDVATSTEVDDLSDLTTMVKEILTNKMEWDFTSSPNYGILYIKDGTGLVNKYSMKCYKENGVDKPANSQEVAIRKDFTVI